MRLGLLATCAALLVCTACSGRPDGEAVPAEAEGDAVPSVGCIPPPPALGEPGTLVGMDGGYALTMVVPDADGSARSAEGTLTLIPQVEDLLEMSSVRTPLYGSTDIDVAAVGALPVGILESDDPLAPGVLVMESSTEGVPPVRLRFGSDANRRDLVRFDGGYTLLTVTEISSDGFAGLWRSGVGGTLTDGHFCARLRG